MSKIKYGSLFGCVAVFLCLCILLLFPQYVSDSAQSGISTCLTVIVPTLFPFFVLSSIIVDMGFASYIGRIFAPFMRGLFNLPKEGGAVLFLGLISGFPVGAKTAVKIYENGLCTKSEAERMLTFSNNPSPAFVIATVGYGLIGNVTIGWVLFVCQTLAAIIVGVFMTFMYKTPESKEVYSKINMGNGDKNFALCFTEAVKNSFTSVLNVCAFIIFFVMLTGLMDNLGFWKMFADNLSFLKINPDIFKAVASGFFEITSGVNKVGISFPIKVTVPLLGMILGWSGISVHCQVLSFTLKRGLSSRPYLISKLAQSLVCGCLAFIASNIMF